MQARWTRLQTLCFLALSMTAMAAAPPDARLDALKREAVSEVEGIAFVHFHEGDVVRHPLVQRIVKAYDNYEAAKEAPAASTTC